ncbi:hypothetical protein PBI_SCTP2_417 [Salicola phage SCTP-2]|nr:hypothetical protein PBI_SCTP2_417 [Salicola phage SCTP-2]
MRVKMNELGDQLKTIEHQNSETLS